MARELMLSRQIGKREVTMEEKELIDISDFDVKKMTQDEAVEYIRKKIESEIQSFLHTESDIDFVYNDILDEVMCRFFVTFSHTLDKVEYVPMKYLKKMYKIIFKNFKRAVWHIRSARSQQRKNLKKHIEKQQKKEQADDEKNG